MLKLELLTSVVTVGPATVLLLRATVEIVNPDCPQSDAKLLVVAASVCEPNINVRGISGVWQPQSAGGGGVGSHTGGGGGGVGSHTGGGGGGL